MKRRKKRYFTVCLVLFVITPVMVQAAFLSGAQRNWSTADRSSAHIAPEPSELRDAVIQVFAARTWGKRGIVATHSWIIFKRNGAEEYTRYDMIGWGGGAVRKNGYVADGKWFGNEPNVLLDIRGQDAADIIPKIEQAVADYPYANQYRTWPGPNSNTFIAFIGRRVPEMRLHMPSTAIGKDYMGANILGTTTSGTGAQLSLAGLIGISIAGVEGVEVNVLGLVLGIDIMRPAIKLPAIGRIGFPQATD